MLRQKVFYGWWIVALCSIMIVVGHGILFHSFTVFFLPLKREFAVSAASISLLYGAARLEGGAEGPVVGYFIDRFGARPVMIAGACMAGIGMILLATVHSFWAFFITYIILVSVGYNTGFWHPAYAVTNSWFMKKRGTALAIISASGSIGGMLMAPFMSFLILDFSWRIAVIVAGAMILVVVVPAASLIQRSPEALGLYPDGKPFVENEDQDGKFVKSLVTQANFTLRQASRTLTYWLLVLGITLRILVTVALSVHLVPLLVWKGVDEATAAYLVSLYAFSMIIIILLMGWIGDRWNRALLCSLGALVGVGALILMLISKNDLILYLFPIMLAVPQSTASNGWALIGDYFGRLSYAKLRGIAGISVGIGTFLAPVYAGWILDKTGSYDIVLTTFSIILLLTAFIFFVIRRPRIITTTEESIINSDP